MYPSRVSKSKLKTNPMVPVPLLMAGALFLLCCCSDETCADCQREKCSDLLAYCERDAGCACVADCVGREGIPGVGGCLEQCGLAERPTGYLPVQQCVATACPDSDECSVPSGYTVEPVAGSGASPTEAGAGGSSGRAGIGGGDQPDCGFDPEMVFNADGEILQLQSTDQDLCVRLQRRNDGQGSLANTKWTLLEIRVGPLGEAFLVDDPSAICWYSSHHNFSDWAHAWTGSRRFDLQLHEDGHGGARTYELWVFEQGPVDPGVCAPLADGSGLIAGPIELFPFPS